ncbi:LacI family transcriptional regulator [Virgibacillus pantothenticus]|uniref:LacI family DNA-binding transcriptional regulator n=1 Tax=Virgibacillus pantothenticus TaxID=1473 RepID=UPI001C2222E4|nr:LacI family DNA-binding transcriptional regulator [Virgibacillus pantothenticus]MBU8568551.1 LacI family transcriptional regulator [Virgibacillus pantothenticus]MBU8602478.1 LacI family transcriptional regulator [Virgibacillus pantothenticus]MBU8636661.1 LacI family transcriptional regulator [Virgibacillus pantothenticus]MBU8644361.1 LacI family transcriptional regulator [Virgibacillus pantothenticus]MBU8648479.1 LacI family transcriptional regulator [Virgibacillus pantothenticus]
MSVTIYDVAKAANVSIATVSQVINNKGRISEKTKKKVHKVMEELNYQPNILASALMGKQTKTIGLLIPDLANPFFSELARSIEDSGHVFGYNIVICSTDYKVEKEVKYISLLKQKRVDGFIFASGFEKLDQVEALMNENVPVVIVARDFPMRPLNTVAIDDYMGGYQAASYLLKLGHTNMGIIALDVWSNRERIRGFNDALKEQNIEIRNDFEYITQGNENLIDAGKAVAHKYVTTSNPPTAIFSCNDMLAIGAIQAAKENGFHVPSDLSIVGFDNTAIATIVDPPLTTISQPIEKMGKEVMDLMISIVKGERKEQLRLTLMPTLVERKSTAKLT